MKMWCSTWVPCVYERAVRMMRDPRTHEAWWHSRKDLWDQMLRAKERVLNDYDGTCEWSRNSYEVARFKGSDILLIFYPYKCPSATGHRLRVRDCSKDKGAALEILARLEDLCGINQRNGPTGIQWWDYMAEIRVKYHGEEARGES